LNNIKSVSDDNGVNGVLGEEVCKCKFVSAIAFVLFMVDGCGEGVLGIVIVAVVVELEVVEDDGRGLRFLFINGCRGILISRRNDNTFKSANNGHGPFVDCNNIDTI
jgi:hypothetical protein